MQSHQDSFGTDALKNRGHRRSETLGKSMPITSLLLNYTPSSLQISDNIRSDAGTGNISPTQRELPPLYFPIHEISPNREVNNLKKSSEQQQTQNLDTDDEVEIIEQDYEILVSECSSSNGDLDQEDERRKSNSEEYISLIGNSKFYTPCLTCVGSAPTELTTRPSAINEMCRRLCTEECRLRLSLAGLVTPSENILKNRELLEDHVQTSLEKPIDEIYDTPPQLPPRPVKKDDMAKLETPLPSIPFRPPGNIAIQRKKFLTDILMQNMSSDEEDLDKQEPPKELLDIVTSIVVPPTPKSQLNSLKTQNSEDEAKGIVKIDPHELEMLKDFREKFEIAEALAKTSAMTSTSKIKQRLAARKLEIELDNAKAVKAAAKKQQNQIEQTQASTSDGGIVVDDNYKHLQPKTGLVATSSNENLASDDDNDEVQGVPDDAVTKANNLSHKILDAVSPPYYDNDYEPPRELLLYLVR